MCIYTVKCIVLCAVNGGIFDSSLCAVTDDLFQIHEGVKPTLQELERFEATPEEVDLEGKHFSTHNVLYT